VFLIIKYVLLYNIHKSLEGESLKLKNTSRDFYDIDNG